MRFVCLGYSDEGEMAQVPEGEMQKRIEACFAYDDELRRGGHMVGGEALQPPDKGVSLRSSRGGKVTVTDGPFAETKEVLGGLLVLEARDLNHAIALMSKHPGLAFGRFEIRPSNEEIKSLSDARDEAFHSQSVA